MKIALYGIYGTYNFGCEAIVRGAIQFIRDVFPDAEVKYLSYSYEYDREALADLKIEIVPITEKRTFIKRCINKGLKLFNINTRVFFFDLKNVTSDIDMILSIGGDIYTIPAVLRENEKYHYYNSLVDFCEKSKKPIVVYGASVGPWGHYGKAVKYYSEHLRKYKAILCREKNSVDYLMDMGFDNVMFFPDPAFQLGEGKNNSGEYIGINLSPLSLNEIYGNHSKEHIKKLAKTIDEIISTFNRPIMFLPHVLSTDENDNDLLFGEQIRDAMKYSDRVSIADSSNGFLGIKEQIRNCHIVISARMHCAINAMEENVPTILLSYSQKSVGMCEYVYGNTKWCIDLQHIDSNILESVREMDSVYDEIVEKLANRNEEIKLEYRNNIEMAKQMVSL